MYQSCNRRLLPSMATSGLLSPSAKSKPCSLHCNSQTLHRPCSGLGLRSLSRSSGGKSRTSLNMGFLSSVDSIHSRSHPPCCCFCCGRDCVRRACFCVTACSNLASMASSLLVPGNNSHFNMKPVLGTSAETSVNRTWARSSSTTSLALTTKRKTKERSAGRSLKNAESPVPDIHQHSLTWGIVPHPKEGKQKVIDFLQKEGVETSELEDVELPNTIEVMQERLDFLKKLGLSMETINTYPLMVTCSIKKNIIPVLDYLEQLGLRSKELPKFIEKYPMILHSSVVIDLMPVVDYLLGLDIQRRDIIKVLYRYPDVLGFRLEGTMSTSVAYLVSLGVRMRCIGRMLTEYPEILGMRVGNNIKPKVDFLLSNGIPKPVVAKLLEVRPYMLGFDLSDTMEPVVNDLMDAGVRKEGIANIISQYPDILGQGIRENLIRKTKWLVQEMNVKSENVPVVIEKLPQILFIKEGLAMERVRFFRNAGLSEEDVARMVTDCPQVLALSIGQVIEPSMKYLLHEMKRSVKEVAKFPAYFTYDLKSRIMPRYQLIAEKGVDCSLEWFLNCTDQRFKMRLSADYLEEEHEPGPIFQMGGVIHSESKPMEEEDALFDENLDAEGRRREEPRISSSRERQITKLYQQQRRDKHLETTSDSDIEAFSGDEDELDKFKLPSAFGEVTDDDDDELELNLRGIGNGNKSVRTQNQGRALKSHRAQQDMYSDDEDADNDDDTDDANEILQARLQDGEDLDMLESASEYDVSEEEEEEHDDDDDDDDDDDEGEEWSMSETDPELYERGEDIDDWDEDSEEDEQHRAINKRNR